MHRNINKKASSSNNAIYERLMKDISKIVKNKLNEEFSEIEDISENDIDNPSVKIGDEIHIISMMGEPQYTDRTGTVEYIDDMNQIHGTWGGCALQPENDEYEVI